MIVGGVGIGDVATDGGPVSHDRIGYPSRGIEQDRVTVTDEARVIQFCLAGQGTDTQYAVGFLDVVQFGDAIDINQDRWPGQAETQEGNEALATCQDFGIVAMLIQEGDGLGNTASCHIIEGGRNQSITSNSRRGAEGAACTVVQGASSNNKPRVEWETRARGRAILAYLQCSMQRIATQALLTFIILTRRCYNLTLLLLER